MSGPRPLPWLSGLSMREANQNWVPYKRGCLPLKQSRTAAPWPQTPPGLLTPQSWASYPQHLPRRAALEKGAFSLFAG